MYVVMNIVEELFEDESSWYFIMCLCTVIELSTTTSNCNSKFKYNELNYNNLKSTKKPKNIKGFILVEKRKRDNVHKIKDIVKFKPKRHKLKMHLRSADGEKILTDWRAF